MGKRLTQEEFVSRANLIHSNKYSYEKVTYKNRRSKIIITCPIHGDFELIAGNHLKGRGCPKCAKCYRYNNEEYIELANKIHNNKYNYNKTNYINSLSKIIITCPIHGDFSLRADFHLQRVGCPKCANKNVTTKEFIEKARKVHGDRYDYSKTIYKHSRLKIYINCKIHGEFLVIPNSHIYQRQGCPKCSKSKGELIIENWLNNHKVNYIDLYSIDIDTNINSKGITKVDFYLPDYNIIIEYNGEQHYRPIHFYGGELRFNAYLIPRDNAVKQYCKNNNIKLIEIPYTMNISEINNLINNNIKQHGSN